MSVELLLTVSDPAALSRRLAGMTVIERQLFTARRAGVRTVWVDGPAPAQGSRMRVPAGLEVRWGRPAPGGARRLSLPAERLVRVDALAEAVRSPAAAEAALSKPGAAVDVAPPGPALRWLLATGTKSQDGFMARNFDRHISLAVSRFLLPTPVTPNMMTVLSSLIGLFGAAFFLRPAHGPRLAGALLIWLHSVLDGCDGELARLRFQESAAGATIDFWGDNLVHVALFSCMAWGFFKADQSFLPLLCGAAAAVGTLGSAALVYASKRKPAKTQTAGSFLQRLEDALAARDFIYLLVFLAYIDRTYEFLWAAAVGSLLFLIMTLYLGGQNEQASQPYPRPEGQVGHPASGHGGGL